MDIQSETDATENVTMPLRGW